MKACGFISYVLFLACRILLFYIVCSVFGLSDRVVLYRMFCFCLVGSCCFILYVLFFSCRILLFSSVCSVIGLSDLVLYRMMWLWLVGSCCFLLYVLSLACRILLSYLLFLLSLRIV